MNEKTKIEVNLLLPYGNDCRSCVERLRQRVDAYRGIEIVHIEADGDLPRFCIHYDPNLISVDYVRALATEEGAHVAWRYQHETLPVLGLDCADCAQTLEAGIKRLDGVLWVSVNFAASTVGLEYDAGQVDRSTILRVAEDLGYPFREADEQPGGAPHRPRWFMRRRDLTTIGAGVLIAVAVLSGLLGLPEAAVATIYVAAIVVGGFYIARTGWAALRATHSLDMNALMTIAAVGAVLVGEWAEGAVAMFLFSLGNTLEGYTMDRARNAIRALMDLSPRRATVLHGDTEEQVAVEDLRIGDRILARPGERISMDGVVLTGESAVNQAPITGESVPVEKMPGDEVFAGTVNGQGALTIRVTHLAADTTIARIIKMVEEAQAQKAPAQRFVDRFARVYTPAVIAIAAGVAVLPPLLGWLLGAGALDLLFGEWVYRALVLLVIACPCALVISTPVTIVSAIASAARAGVLIKGGVHLEALSSLRVIAFDKTGTLTIGQPRVVDVHCVDHQAGLAWTECADCRQMLVEAAAIERFSEHPLAWAVVWAAETMGLASALPAAEGVHAILGQGVRGRVGDHDLTVGTHTYIHQEHPDLIDGPLCHAIHAAQDAGQTVMVIRDDCCGVRGYISVADTLRAGIPAVMEALEAVGIEHKVMLTGDNEATAQAIAGSAGMHEVQANLLPDQKVVAIEALLDKYGPVAMVGDGVNDAPALARATVGIAMGAAGTDTALETSDVALMADNLGRLPFAIRLSRNAQAIIRQNVALSLGIKAVFFVLALAGVATLWMAVFADVGASLIVTLNGMRLLRER